MIVETTEHHPTYGRRFGIAYKGSSPRVALFAALLFAPTTKGAVSFYVDLSLTPVEAYKQVQEGLLAVFRTRVLAEYPQPILAHCYYGPDHRAQLDLSFAFDDLGEGRTRATAVCPPDGNTSA